MCLSNSSLKEFSLTLVDKCSSSVLICKEHKKTLKNYRTTRYHYKTFHTLTEEQFYRVSKMARLVEARQ